MDREKYPNYFLGIIVLYAVVLLIGLSYFIFPSLSFGAAYNDFYLLLFLFFLPLALLAAYQKISTTLMRLLITAITVVDFIIAFYLMILLI